MKKIISTLAVMAGVLSLSAQTLWSTTLNSGTGLKLGTSTSAPLSFYVNNTPMMTLNTDGILNVHNLAGTGGSPVYIDASGNFYRPIPTPGVPGAPCVTSALPWSQGGNNSPFNNSIGTCDATDFILKANNIPSIFLTQSGYIGLGVNNSAPSAPVDVFDGSSPSNTDHLQFFANQGCSINSTSYLEVFYQPNTGFYITEGGYNSAGPNSTKFMVGGSDTYINTNLHVQSKTLLGSSTGNTNAAKLNINLNSAGSGALGDNALDIYDQNNGKVNFRVKGSGYAYAREINVQTSNFPDYVFNTDYKLQSLQSLENYIKINKHLPNVPTAAEIEKDGANLGELCKIQMEKIEELTLYLIELKKEVDNLKKEKSK